jgi:AbrB family looped-hinge helix DNA binding protein
MQTTIDETGRLVIPEEIREQAGLAPGQPLEIRWHDGRIEIEPVTSAVRLVQKGHLVVAVSDDDLPPLTHEDVESVRQAILDERMALFLGPEWDRVRADGSD